MKRFMLVISVMFMLFSFAYSQENIIDKNEQKNKNDIYYVGINPVSYIASFQLQDDIKRYIPEVSGLEYGLSLTGGYFINPTQILEARFSWGNTHQIARVAQLHLGMNYFILKNSNKSFNNFYIGSFLKFWDYYNRLTKIHFYNIAPYLTIGYLFQLEPILLDIRINQTFAVYSWSTLKHSSAGTDWFFSPWPEFLSVMPSLTFSIAWEF